MSRTHRYFSGGGTVDFQEFVGGLSAFSSRGGREEKLRCLSLFFLDTTLKLIFPLVAFVRLKTSNDSRLQRVRCRSRWVHLQWRALFGVEDDGWQQFEGMNLTWPASIKLTSLATGPTIAANR